MKYQPRRLILTIACGAAGFAAGLSCGYWRWNVLRPPSYAVARAGYVGDLAVQHGRADTLVLGDSLSEQTDFAGACGTVFDAGVGGAEVREIEAVWQRVRSSIRPRLVIVNAGTNDLLDGRSEAQFYDDYGRLLASLRGTPVILFGLRRSQDLSRFIAAAARARGAEYLPPIEGPGLIAADGIHFTPAGARRYVEAVHRRCPL